MEVFGDTEDIPRSQAQEFLAGVDAWMGEEPTKGCDEVVESASSAEESSSVDGDATDEEGFQEEQGFIGTSNLKRVIEGNLLQHNKKTRVLHRVDVQKSSAIEGIYVATCGATGASYRHLPRGANFQWPMCQRCYRKIDTIDRFVEQEEASKTRMGCQRTAVPTTVVSSSVQVVKVAQSLNVFDPVGFMRCWHVAISAVAHCCMHVAIFMFACGNCCMWHLFSAVAVWMHGSLAVASYLNASCVSRSTG